MFDTLVSWFFFGGLYLVALLGLLVILILIVSRNKTQATSVPEGTVEVIYQGGDWLRPIVNFEGFEVTREGILYRVETEEEKWVDPKKLFVKGKRKIYKDKKTGRIQLVPCSGHWLDIFLKPLGVQFVSFIYPHRTIRSLPIDVKRLIDSDEVAGDYSVSQRLEHETESKPVQSLRIIIQRPVLLKKVELGGDKSQLNIVVSLILQLENVFQPYGRWNGKFFSVIDQAVEAEVVAFCQNENVTYERFVQGDFISVADTRPDAKKKEKSTFSSKLMSINSSSKGAPTGLPNEIGYSVVAAWLVDFEGADADFEKAQRAKELEKQKALGVIEKARGERDALKEVAVGQAARWEESMERLINSNVSPDIAALVIARQIEAEAVGSKESNVTTWVQGGSDTKPMIPVGKP